ncbi:MAG: NAD(P)-dependent oxidoreductase [Elusimicrobia bacterium]|nr:NAD(P)-dependent oxidoreductase [Elusimicrobiota bacterium]
MPPVVVTGASGFLGRELVRALQTRGCEVVAAGRSAAARGAGCPPVRGVNIEELSRFAGAVCVHLAGANALADDAAARREREDALRLAAGVREAGFARIIFASSAAVYDEAFPGPHTELSVPKPASAYGRLKLDLESLFLPRHAVARISNLYGPGMSPANVFSHIMGQLRVADEVVVRNLTSARDYLFVGDAVEALAALALSQETGVFNVSTGRATRVSELLDMLARLMGRARCSARVLHPYPPPSSLVLDPSRLERATGWRHRVRLEMGLKLLVEAMR